MTTLVAADFGIVGDGVTDSTDGFVALRARLLSDRDRLWEVEFAPGHYLTRFSPWLANVGRVRLIGYGATLQHLTANKALFSPHEFFRNLIAFEPFPAAQQYEHHPGWRIVSAEAGDIEVRFLDGAVPPSVMPGAAVFVGGLNQQFTNETPPRSAGWPPNLRFGDFGEVLSVGADSVTLRGRLAHNYDHNWPDYEGDYFGPYRAGAPRLYLLDRPNFSISRHIEFHGFKFARALGSTSETAGTVSFASCLYLLLEDCDWVGNADLNSNSGYVQMCDRIVMRRCRLDGLEVDKNLRHVLLEDCDIGERGLTSDGAGCAVLELKNMRLHGICRINPRTVIAENVTAHRNFQLNAAHGGYYDTLPFTVTTRATRP